MSWLIRLRLNFLQYKVLHGNELALAILRSKDEEVQPEASKIVEKKKLLALSYVYQALNEDLKQKGSSIAENFKARVDTKGVLIVTLQNGVIIKDNGKKIEYRAYGNNEGEVKEFVNKMERLKFGKRQSKGLER